MIEVNEIQILRMENEIEALTKSNVEMQKKLFD